MTLKLVRDNLLIRDPIVSKEFEELEKRYPITPLADGKIDAFKALLTREGKIASSERFKSLVADFSHDRDVEVVLGLVERFESNGGKVRVVCDQQR